MDNENIATNTDFGQVCVWQGVLVGEENKVAFVEHFAKNFNARVQYLEEIKTSSGQGGEGGRNDVFFSIHEDDLTGDFCVRRLALGIRWLEDVLDNQEVGDEIYPERVKDYRTW